jgi:hypothetical protein
LLREGEGGGEGPFNYLVVKENEVDEVVEELVKVYYRQLTKDRLQY